MNIDDLMRRIKSEEQAVNDAESILRTIRLNGDVFAEVEVSQRKRHLIFFTRDTSGRREYSVNSQAFYEAIQAVRKKHQDEVNRLRGLITISDGGAS